MGALPGELANKIASYLKPESFNELIVSSKQIYGLFTGSVFDVVAQEKKVFNKFLECIAYGQQDKAEKLLSQVFQGQPEKIQAALLHQGTFTDYSGRTFYCSAYEYAYWAKDTHMCRMLERYMDDKTKAQMLTRIDAIEAHGLAFHQNAEEHRSAHFDFTPLKEAYQRYLAGYDEWLAANDWGAMDAAWLDVGQAQRNVPAHVAQEYCRPDRSFHPTPEFNEATLPRVLTFDNWRTGRVNSWFPLAASNSGLGFDFALIRGGGRYVVRWAGCVRWGRGSRAADLAAITRLDEVRTVDLTQSREHLNPPAMSQSMSV